MLHQQVAISIPDELDTSTLLCPGLWSKPSHLLHSERQLLSLGSHQLQCLLSRALPALPSSLGLLLQLQVMAHSTTAPGGNVSACIFVLPVWLSKTTKRLLIIRLFFTKRKRTDKETQHTCAINCKACTFYKGNFIQSQPCNHKTRRCCPPTPTLLRTNLLSTSVVMH